MYDLDDLVENFAILLEIENNINYKKSQGIELSDKEYFLDSFLVQPSSFYKILKSIFDRRINEYEKK